MKPEFIIDGSSQSANDGWISKTCHILVDKIESEGNVAFRLTTGNHELYDYFPFNARIFLNGRIAEIVEFSQPWETIRLSYPIYDPSAPLAIRIETDYAATPADRGMNADERELSLIISDLAFEHAIHLRPPTVTSRAPASNSPIFVIGPHQPDTRLLAWAIGQHPNISPMDETRWMSEFYFAAQRAFDAVSRVPGASMRMCNLDLDDFLRRQGQMIDGLHREISRRRSLEIFFSRAETMSPDVDRRSPMIRSSHATKGRWVDGTAGNTDLAIGLSRMFPDAIFIGTLTRPSSALTASLGSGQASVDPEAFRTAVTSWERSTQWLIEAIQHLGPDRALLITQTDLNENPAKSMRTLLDFCGEPYFRACEASVTKEGLASPSASLRLDDAQSSELFGLENIYEQIVSGATMAGIRWKTPPVAFDHHCAAAAGQWGGPRPGE